MRNFAASKIRNFLLHLYEEIKPFNNFTGNIYLEEKNRFLKFYTFDKKNATEVNTSLVASSSRINEWILFSCGWYMHAWITERTSLNSVTHANSLTTKFLRSVMQYSCFQWEVYVLEM